MVEAVVERAASKAGGCGQYRVACAWSTPDSDGLGNTARRLANTSLTHGTNNPPPKHAKKINAPLLRRVVFLCVGTLGLCRWSVVFFRGRGPRGGRPAARARVSSTLLAVGAAI